jgi:hypothetical protein
MLRGPWESGDHQIELCDLLIALDSSYAFVLDTPFGEALRHGSARITELASDIRQKTGLLASTAPEPGARPKQLPIKKTLLFGPWGDGTPEIRQLHDELAGQGFAGGDFRDVLHLTTADAVAARGVPLNQSVWVVYSYHGASIDDFGKMNNLRLRYLSLREGEKPLHVFPEERAASLIEKRIAELRQAGRVSGRIDLLGPEAVGFAREGRLIRQVVLLIVTKRLEWLYDRVDQRGEWVLSTEPGRTLSLATGDKASCILSALVDHAAQILDPSSSQILDTIEQTARGADKFDDEVINRLTAIAAGASNEPGISDLGEDMQMLISVSSLELLGF